MGDGFSDGQALRLGGFILLDDGSFDVNSNCSLLYQLYKEYSEFEYLSQLFVHDDNRTS